MANRVKLTSRRRNRVLTLMAGGASLAEAARACGMTRGAVYHLARRDPDFAERVRVCREHRHGNNAVVALAEPESWEVAAARLEAFAPERWSLPDLSELGA